MKKVLVTGGAGFIGSAVCRYLVLNKQIRVLNVDKLTYAGSLDSLNEVKNNPLYQFAQVDICDESKIAQLLTSFQPDVVMHLAAESHVDRSIDGAADFIQTNIVGTYTLLECVRKYWSELSNDWKKQFRFLHISTDEVYGSLGSSGLFNEKTAYDPHSPYSASKAASDHLVMAWFHTYGLPVLLTNCSNNYGPYQFPEKLIPRLISNALNEQPLPIFGTGENIRDWLFVEDHVRALVQVVELGVPGEKYNVGGGNEQTNLEVAEMICSLLDEFVPRKRGCYSELIQRVADRPGHDFRYGIDASKMRQTLGWTAQEGFNSGIRKTVLWYLENKWWWQDKV